MSGRVILLALLVSMLPVGVAHADDESSGHLSVEAGALVGEVGDHLTAHALLRAEIAFRLIGPFAAGGFLQTVVADDPMGSPPGFGGGVLLALRPELPLLGFVPHLEVTGARVQLPGHAQALVDAWSIGLGAGVGARLIPELTLEARVRHQWWLGMTPASQLPESAWTVSVALTVDLP